MQRIEPIKRNASRKRKLDDYEPAQSNHNDKPIAKRTRRSEKTTTQKDKTIQNQARIISFLHDTCDQELNNNTNLVKQNKMLEMKIQLLEQKNSVLERLTAYQTNEIKHYIRGENRPSATLFATPQDNMGNTRQLDEMLMTISPSFGHSDLL